MKRILILSAVVAIALTAFAEEKKPPAKEAKEEVKNKAPEFTLADYNGNKHKLSGYKGKWVVLEWVNHGCPYVKKHYNGNMQALQKKYKDKGVVWLSICSSAPGKQGYYKAEDWKKVDKDKGGQATAVLLDSDGKVGKKYGARTTPEMVVINPKGGIVYHGAIDDTRNIRIDVKEAKNYVSQVLDAVLAGKNPPVAKTKPYGCGVKYP